MNQNYHDKIAKICELVKNGATEGEKNAAQTALDKLLKKYNLNSDYIDTISERNYEFKYATNLDLQLFMQLHDYFFKGKSFKAQRRTMSQKRIIIALEYIDWVTISCAYEYFKPHMNKEFRKICIPAIKKCRSAKTKNARRKELQESFFGFYVVKSKIVHESQLKKVDPTKMSAKELADFVRLQAIEGGQLTNQVTTGLYLE
jgi:hypothetical protein